MPTEDGSDSGVGILVGHKDLMMMPVNNTTFLGVGCEDSGGGVQKEV